MLTFHQTNAGIENTLVGTTRRFVSRFGRTVPSIHVAVREIEMFIC